MTDSIEVVVKESGSAQVVSSFDSVASAAQRAHTSIQVLQKTLSSVGRSTAAANRVTALGAAAQGTTTHVTNLNSALGTLNRTRVTSNLNSANAALQNTGNVARSAASGVRDFLGAFLTIATIRRVLGSLVEAQISIQQINFGLIAASGSMRGAADQMAFLRQNAQTMGVDLRSSAQEFTRLSASANAMNVEVKDQQELFTGLSRAATVLHLDTQRVQFATLALTQMFSKGKIQAEELRRQLGEAVPGVVPRFQRAVMKVIEGTDLARFSFEDLMKRGLLDTKKFLPQLIAALLETGRGWEIAAKGLNAEINRLTTAWFDLRVEITKGLFNDAMIAVVRFLSANLKTLTGVVVGLGVAILLAVAPAAIAKLSVIIGGLVGAVGAAASPFLLMGAAIAGVVAFLVTMRDQIKLGVDETTTLGDMMRAAWEGLLPILENISMVMHNIFGGLGPIVVGTFNEILNGAIGFEHENEALWLRVARFIAKVFDVIGGVIVGTFQASLAVLNVFVEAFLKNFSRIGDITSAILRGDLFSLKDLVAANIQETAGIGEQLGEAFSSTFREAILRSNDQGISSVLNAWIEASKIIGKNRVALLPNSEEEQKKDSNTSNPEGSDESRKKLEESLSRLVASIDPAEDAIKRLKEAEITLVEAEKAGLISKDRQIQIFERLTAKYREALDPIGALTDKLREERELLQFSGDELQIQTIVLKEYNRLKKENRDITKETVEQALRPEIEAIIEQTRVQQIQNSILGDTVNARRDELETIRQIAELKKRGEITSGQAAQQVVGIFGEENLRFTKEGVEAEMQLRTDRFRQIQELENQELISHQTANLLRAQSDLQYTQTATQHWADMFGTLAGLASSGNKKIAAIGKAAALAQAVIAGTLAIQQALAAPPGWPGNAGNVAIVTAMQAFNVATIASQGFKTGGSFVVGGAGGADSQTVAFQATPGETVSIATPRQVKHGNPLSENGEDGVVIHLQVFQGKGDSVDAKAQQQPDGSTMIKVFLGEVAADIGSNGVVGRAISRSFGVRRQGLKVS